VRLRGRKPRLLAAAAAVLLPGGARRWVHNRLLGADIHPTARIGRSLVDVDRLVMGPHAVIGSCSVIRGCEEVELAEEAVIGPLVWVNAVRRDKHYFADQPLRRPVLHLKRAALISCLHMVDCCDEVVIGEYSGLAGFGSQVMTHTVDIVRLKQVARPVVIGDHAMVSTSSVLLPGAVVPDNSVVSAGSVVKGPLVEEHTLYEGVPAVAKRSLSPQLAFFHRAVADIR
jgi:acetyltransferase-like isoleucine patch superfamily enzyme